MKKQLGFSVLELLVLLVTISIVTAALAPVFTKRVRSVNATTNPSKVSQNCTGRFSAYCTSCNIRECLTCDRVCNQAETKIISSCTCQVCSTLFANCYACAERQCTKCQQGYWLNKTDNKICTACKKGYYCDGYNEVICPTGTYQSKTTRDHCVKCPKKTYQDEEGKDSCKTCPTGFYCPEEQLKVPVKCKPGYYSYAGWENCLPCPAGTKPNKYQTACEKCEAGTYSTEGNAKFIANGKTQNWEKFVDYSAGDFECLACEDGTYSQAGAGECTNCGKGWYSKKISDYVGASSCTKCPAGTYNDKEKSSVCHDCEDGQYSPAGAAGCTNCKEGEYSKAHSASCSICPAGTFSVNAPNNLGPANCTRCPAGFYQPEAGKNYCIEVPKGHWSTEGATGYTACTPGYYQKKSGQKNCESCPGGTYNTGYGNHECYNCGTGYTSSKIVAATGCTICQGGYYGPAAANPICLKCPGGTYQPSSGQSGCIPCPANHYCVGGTTGYIACSGGMTSSPGSTRCWDPNAGDNTYSDHKGDTKN